MTNEPIPDGPFTEAYPYHRACGSQENHPSHKTRKILTDYRGSKYAEWDECPGWETTHTIEVREASGRVIGEQKLDLRDALVYSGSTNDPLLTLLFDAEEAKEPRPSDDELLFAIAGSRIAPEVCPYDSDRCHEELYEFADALEAEE